ncbi:hypothetical protein ZIOFF_072485 [Zingiber officinale]|uniref:Uncharacterized protein n=1 Tax=Zingiber officinale TaxID=94328 RepID=A0A8J5C5Z2_ZINOF|nr:hypothetical protein ZIOFF_072485 [Zingiber officinale]
MSAALDAGTSFMGVVAFFALGNYNIYSVNWWGGVTEDYCPLAKCPTEPDAYIPEGYEVEIKDDSPIEQVRMTVPTTDDPSLPCLTIRTWILGVFSCVLLSFVNQFFSYRTNQLSISSVCVQILALPIGRWMARVLPPAIIRIPLLNWSFSLNPGPFNMKEHVLLTIIASAGAGGDYAVGIVTIVKAFYHRGINVMAAILLTQTTQLLGFGWAGLFRKFLVDSPYMWWPANLIQSAERRKNGGQRAA